MPVDPKWLECALTLALIQAVYDSALAGDHKESFEKMSLVSATSAEEMLRLLYLQACYEKYRTAQFASPGYAAMRAKDPRRRDSDDGPYPSEIERVKRRDKFIFLRAMVYLIIHDLDVDAARARLLEYRNNYISLYDVVRNCPRGTKARDFIAKAESERDDVFKRFEVLLAKKDAKELAEFVRIHEKDLLEDLMTDKLRRESYWGDVENSNRDAHVVPNEELDKIFAERDRYFAADDTSKREYEESEKAKEAHRLENKPWTFCPEWNQSNANLTQPLKLAFEELELGPRLTIPLWNKHKDVMLENARRAIAVRDIAAEKRAKERVAKSTAEAKRVESIIDNKKSLLIFKKDCARFTFEDVKDCKDKPLSLWHVMCYKKNSKKRISSKRKRKCNCKCDCSPATMQSVARNAGMYNISYQMYTVELSARGKAN